MGVIDKLSRTFKDFGDAVVEGTRESLRHTGGQVNDAQTALRYLNTARHRHEYIDNTGDTRTGHWEEVEVQGPPQDAGLFESLSWGTQVAYGGPATHKEQQWVDDRPEYEQYGFNTEFEWNHYNQLDEKGKRDYDLKRTTDEFNAEQVCVVNNADENHEEGERYVTDFGFGEVKLSGLPDGTLVAIDGWGNRRVLSAAIGMTEDYKAQVDEYMAQYYSNKQDWETLQTLQELAEEGAEEEEADSSYSFLDGLIDLITINSEAQVAASGVYDITQEDVEEDIDKMRNPSQTVRWIKNATLYESDPAEYYIEFYAEDPVAAAEEFLADENISEADKRKLAYSMVTRNGRQYEWTDYSTAFLGGTLNNLGETLDWFANPIKGTAMWIGYNTGADGFWGDKSGAYSELDSMSYQEMIESCFRASWQNEGRVSYNWDTGFIVTDLVMEILSDPEAWLSIGQLAAKKITASSLVDNVLAQTDDLARPSALSVYSAMGSDDAADAFAKLFPESSQQGVKQIATEFLDYSKAYKISQSLGTLKDAKQLVDNFMLWGVGWGEIGGAIKLGKFLKPRVESEILSEVDALKTKAFTDAVAEATANTGSEIPSVLTTAQVIDRYNMNIAAIKLAESDDSLKFLTPNEKYDMIRTAYHLERVELENTAALDALTKNFLEAHELTDTPLYRSLEGTQTVYKPVDMKLPNYVKEARTTIQDVDQLEFWNKELKEAGAQEGTTLNGEVYNIMIDNQRVAASLADNNEYLRVLQSDTLMDATSTEVMQMAKNTDNIYNRVMKTRTGTENYLYITRELENSAVFTASESKWVQDYLYNSSFMRKVDKVFSAGDVGLNSHQITSKTRALAKRWIDGAFNLKAKYEEVQGFLFDKKCNTSDAVLNLENIEKEFNALEDVYKNSKHTPVFYTTPSDDASVLCVKYGDDMQVFDIATPEGVHSFDLYLTDITEQSRVAHKQLEMVGFNTHGSGMDIDAEIRSHLKFNRSVTDSRFFNTTDIAEILRTQNGLVVPTQQMYDEANRLLDQCMYNWHNTYDMFYSSGTKIPFALTAPKQDWWEDSVRIWKSTSDKYTDNAAFSTLNDMFTKADEALKDVDEAYKHLYATGQLTVDKGMFMQECYKLTDNEVQIHKVWSESMMSQYIDQTVLPEGFDTTKLYEEFKSIENIRTELMPEAVINMHQYRDLMQYDLEIALKDDSSWHHAFGWSKDTIGLKLEDMTDEQITAMYIWVNRETGGQVLSLMGSEEMTFDIGHWVTFKGQDIADAEITFQHVISNPYDWLIKGTNKAFVVDEIAPGIFGKSENSWVRLTREVDAMNSISEADNAFREMDNYLNRNHVQGEALYQYKMRVREKLHKEYDQLRNIYEQAKAEGIANHEYRMQHSEGTAKQLAGAIDTGIYDALDQSLYKFYDTRTNQRINYLLSLDTEQFSGFMSKYAGGTLAVENARMNKVQLARLRQIATESGCEVHDDIGHTIIIGGSAAEDFTLPAMELVLDDDSPFAGLVQELAKHNDVSFTFGEFIPATDHMNLALHNRYFAKYTDQVSQVTTGYTCSYIGSIENMRLDGEMISNNSLVNMLNAYTHTCKQIDDTEMLLQEIFQPGKFDSIMEDLIDRGVIKSKYDEIPGFQVCSLTVRGDDIKLVKGIRGNVTALLSYNDFTELQSVLGSKGSVHIIDKPAMKPLKAAWSAYIQTYLYSSPGTWVHNYVDSTLKGVMSEGTSHLAYMKEAGHVNQMYKDAQEVIGKAIANGDAYSVRDYFKTYGEVVTEHGVLSEQRYWDVDQFFHSALVDGDVVSAYEIAKGAIPDAGYIERIKAQDTTWKKFESALLDNPYFHFNAGMFSKVENTNRMAIYLKRLDMGDNFNEALQRVGRSQFDYTKTKMMQMTNLAQPFIQFRLNNYGYWYNSLVEDGGAWMIGNLATMYNDDGFDENYWSEDGIRWRTYVGNIVHSNGNRDEIPLYNAFEDYNGTNSNAALSNGWVKIGGDLYFKLGLSYTDAISGLTTDPTEHTFSPIKDAINALMGESGLDNYDDPFTKFMYGYSSDIPLFGTMAYQVLAGVRNKEAAERMGLDPATADLVTYAPFLFALSKQDTDYATKLALSYLGRPVGTDWYEQSDEYKKMHRFVMGVSNLNAWMQKDPATYINTWGRLEALGLTTEQVTQFMNDGGGFWFTKNNDGSYQLHNYQLMVGDEATWNKLYGDLVQKWGWTPDAAERLLNEAAIPTWTNTHWDSSNGSYAPSAHAQGYGKYNNYRSKQVMYAAMNNMRATTWQHRLYPAYPGQPDGVKALTSKRPDTPHKIARNYQKGLNNNRQTVYRWHQRTRDIYHDNYAKYGASRMAMNQNLRAYSNRSITEMYRTNQKLAYARIHSRWWSR